MFVSYLCAYQNQGKALWIMTIYLRMLPLSLEHEDTTWRRVDDSWWSFPSYLKLSLLELFMRFLSRLHPLFLILLSCHTFDLWSLTFLLDLPPHSFLCLQWISGQHIPEGIYNFEVRVVCPEFCSFPLC
jgi:hypothetical protein